MTDKYIVPVILFMTMILSLCLYVMVNTKDDATLISNDYEIKKVTANEVLEIKANDTYGEIIKSLGKTKDVGSGVHVAQYIVNDSYIFLSFVETSDKCALSGEELLANARPIIINQVGIRGTVTSLTAGKESITILVEGDIASDTQYDKASVIVNEATEVVQDGSDAILNYKSIKGNDEVEVIFTGPVAESYPVQGTAKKVTILNVVNGSSN